MPMYYFNLQDGETITDIEGTNLSGLEAALEHAGIVARELMAGTHSRYQREWSELLMSVRDWDGRELFQLPLSEFKDKG